MGQTSSAKRINKDETLSHNIQTTARLLISAMLVMLSGCGTTPQTAAPPAPVVPTVPAVPTETSMSARIAYVMTYDRAAGEYDQFAIVPAGTRTLAIATIGIDGKGYTLLTDDSAFFSSPVWSRGN